MIKGKTKKRYVRKLFHHKTKKEIKLFRVLEKGRREYAKKYGFAPETLLVPTGIKNSNYLITFSDLDTKWIAESLSGRLDGIPLYQAQYTCLKFLEYNLREIEKHSKSLAKILENAEINYQNFNAQKFEDLSKKILSLSRKNKKLSKAYINSISIREKFIKQISGEELYKENPLKYIGKLDD